MQQEEAFSLLKMGKNVFLTGAAGAGKTYLLNKYITYLKENQVKVAVTASTGIAATHLQGTTLHSWSGIGIKDQLNASDLEKILTSKRIKSNYKKTKVLIIDEISMVHPYQLDMVDNIARRILSSEEAFAGIQIVVCGDFFQLPPVNPNPLPEEKPYFAFEASAWTRGNFQVCYLAEQHRQTNDPLLAILNDIRNGTAGEHTKIPLRTRYKKEPQGATKATRLYSRNVNVDAINERELANIQGEEKIFMMSGTGFGTFIDSLKRNCLAQEQLRLKVGAEVMFVKNDQSGRYANGTRGVVIDFDKKADSWPVVRTCNNRLILASPEEWTYEEQGIIRASISQIPLRLAWAITIHKSQGMTLDTAEMDLGDAFEPGMGYVALSRVRSLNGLKLMNLNEMALKVHPAVLQQDILFKEKSSAAVSYLQSLSAAEQAECHWKTLSERFKGGLIKAVNRKTIDSDKKTEASTHLLTLNLLKEQLSIDYVVEKRGLSPGTIMTHIEKLKGLKLLDNVSLLPLRNKLPKEDFDLIYTELKKSADGKMKPVFEKFEGKYTYSSIQLVRLFVEQ